MSKIVGVTVGTPLSPQTIKEKLKKDGFYPVISVSDIEGGHRITITDTNGTKTVDLKNGEDGINGKDGTNGKDGSNGADGVGIKSVTQTTTSTADDGNNVITVTLTNGTKSTFKVQNGSKGSAGENGKDGSNGKDGKDGKTPVKGTDYWTAADKTEIVNAVISALPKYDGEVVAV